MSENSVRVLSEEECWEFLSKNEFGRLAYHLADEVQIVPINYCADEGALYFRTSEGNKLLGVTMNQDVAFEADDLGSEEAVSVIVRGTAEQISGAEKARAEQLPLRPWVPSEKGNVVKIQVSEISGRQFALSKPWTHMR